MPALPGDLGDANHDGVRANSRDDEFIELVNASDFAVDLSGSTIWDQETLDRHAANSDVVANHVVPDGTILGPRQALVVFGGGDPGVDAREFLADGTTPNPDFGMRVESFGGALVQVASGLNKLDLNNGGDTLYVRDVTGTDAIVLDITTARWTKRAASEEACRQETSCDQEAPRE